MLIAPLLVALSAAATQAPASPALPTAPPAPSSRYTGKLFISPMGEPYRPSRRDDDTLADWFRQADQDHDGRLTLLEMQQDAKRFFATLDVGQDGEIDPDDISRYESVVAPEIQSGSSFGLMAMDSADGAHKRAFRGSDSDPHLGAGRFGLLDLPEPVVSADTNFNRGVSLAEFQQAAGQRFMALDVDHRGYLTLASLQGIRPAPPSAPKPPGRSSEPDESALPDPGY